MLYANFSEFVNMGGYGAYVEQLWFVCYGDVDGVLDIAQSTTKCDCTIA